MASYQNYVNDNNWFNQFMNGDNNSWQKKLLDLFDFKKFTGLMSSGGSGGSNNNNGNDDDDDGKPDDDDDDGKPDDDVDQSPINSASISFDIGIREVELNGKTSFQNVVDQCVFHSPESFDPLCIKCMFLNNDGQVIAQGEVEDPDMSYTASDQVPIEMFPSDVEPASIDVQDVEKVRLEICGSKGGQGCTPGFWKTHTTNAVWGPTGYSTSNSFRTIFEIDVGVSLSIQVQTLSGKITVPNPTLLQALGALGGDKAALMRHAVAALLNSAHPDVDYFNENPQAIIDMVEAAIESGNTTTMENLKNQLESENERGCPFGDDKCDCEDRKEEYNKYFDDHKKFYDNNKMKFGKEDYRKYMNDYEKYFDDNGNYMDKYDYKQYMDYYKKFLDDNKKYFNQVDYKKYSDNYKKYSGEFPEHDDNCRCDDNNHDDDDDGKQDDDDDDGNGYKKEKK